MQRSRYLYFILIIWIATVSRDVFCGDETNETEDGDDDDTDDDDSKQSSSIEDFVGTNLFGNDGCTKKCFSTEDVALLAARKEFESVIPKDLEKSLLNDESVETLMQYFYGVHQITMKLSKGTSQIYTQKAFYDALGGYLYNYLMPVTKFSFYAGVLSLKTTERVANLLQNCKTALNTYGIGWKPPAGSFHDFDNGIEPLNCSSHRKSDEKDENACSNLKLVDDQSENDEDMIVSLPKLDPPEMGCLSNIWLPFKRKHIFNLQSSLSAFILIRYFVSVSKCYRFQDVCQDSFNFQLKNWLQENIEPHLNDNVLYPGLGAFLRILKTIEHVREPTSKTSKKSLKVLRDCGSGNKITSAFGKEMEKEIEKDEEQKKTGFWASLFTKKSKSDEDNEEKHIGEGTVDDDDDTSEDEKEDSRQAYRRKRKRRDLFMTILMIVLILLILLFLILMIMKYMRDLGKTDKSNRMEKQGSAMENSKRKKGGLSTLVRKRSGQRKAITAGHNEESITLRSDSCVIMPECGSDRLKGGGATIIPSRSSSSSVKLSSTYSIVENGSPVLMRRSHPSETIAIRTEYCSSCQQPIEPSDTNYTHTSSTIPKELKKCRICAGQDLYPLAPKISPSKKQKYSWKKFLSSKKHETAGTNERRKCSRCSQQISQENPFCQHELDKCNSCCGCCGKSEVDKRWKCSVCSCFIGKDDKIYKDNPNCPIEKRICSNCVSSGRRAIQIWKCIACQKPIKQDDPIYFRDPNCPINRRKCSGCHGREKSKFNCISCARPVKDHNSFYEPNLGRKCFDCWRGGKFRAKKKNIHCVSCKEMFRTDDPQFLKNPEKALCAKCKKSNPISCIYCSNPVQSHTVKSEVDCPEGSITCADCFYKLRRTKTKAKWICAFCKEVINENDPIYYKRPSCPKDKRQCLDCLNRMKFRWICVSCKVLIDRSDPVYAIVPKCPKDKRKCVSCQRKIDRTRRLVAKNRPMSPVRLNSVYNARVVKAKPFSISKKRTNTTELVVGNIVEETLEEILGRTKSLDVIQLPTKSIGELPLFMLPKDLDRSLLNDDAIEVLMQYFYGANQIVSKMTEGNAKIYAEKAFYDALGGYLNCFVIPICKLSYYAGVLSLKTTQHVYDLLEQCKVFLNTNGNGWRPPSSDFSNMEPTIEFLDLSSNISDDNENGKTACLNLNLADEHSENEEDMIVSLPKLDPEEMGQLSNIWFPFKRKHTFNLKSQHSAFILIKYFVSVSRCCHSQGVPQFTFNQRFKEWIAEHIEPHLNDEVLYPGLGAVLRILETIEKENKSTRSSKQSHSIKSSRDSLKPKKANAPTADPKLATLPKASQIALKTSQVESKPKEKLNFFQQFFDRNLADAVDNDEKNPDLKGDENFKVKRKNYIIAAVAVSVILMVFVCIVAIMTKNIREICKGRAQQKKLKKRRQKELEREVGGSTGPLSLGKNRYRKQPKRSHEEEGLTTTASSTVSKESMTDVQQYQYEYGGKYDCRPEPSAMFFPMCKQRPPPYNRQISRDSSPQTKPAKPTGSKQSRRSKAGTELCQNCGQQLPGRNQVGGRDYVNYCFCKSRESLGEPPPTIEPTRQPSPPPIFQSKSPQKPQLTTCLRLPTPPKPRRRLSPRIKPVQPSLSPPKFSISKKNKPAKETSFRLGSPKKSSMKKTKSKLGETRVVLRQDLPCQCPSNSKCKHSPGNFESKSSTHSLGSSPSTAEHTTAAKRQDSSQPVAGPSQNRSSPPRKHPPSKSCPNFGRKHEFVSTSWETLDSKRE